MKPAYIKGLGAISPQPTATSGSQFVPVSYRSTRLPCLEPDYTPWIAPPQQRRMSRIIKMGVAAAAMAMKEADVKVPDAIITGTGLGCLHDTGQFLGQISAQNENALNPTPFILSTHNTIGSQIALLLHDQGYNQTYAHDAFSFESALIDAQLQLIDHPELSILVGGVDEITDASHAIHSRFGIYRKFIEDSLGLFDDPGSGTIQGEGSAWFVLSGTQAGATCCLQGIQTIHKPDANTVRQSLINFLASHDLRPSDIDIVISGRSGDVGHDEVMIDINNTVLEEASVAVFKHLCGEYPVSTSFALWLAATVMRNKQLAPRITLRDKGRSFGQVLIHNQYLGVDHSFILIRSC